MRSTGPWLRFLLCLSLGVGLTRSNPSRAEDGAPARGKLGETIPNFTLRNAAGTSVALHDLKGRKAVVIVFLSFDCPVATSYAQALAELARTYASRDVTFLGIGVGDEAPGQGEKHARDLALPFPVYRDERRAAVAALRAEVTPEAFVLDGGFVLRYRGRIDDRYVARLKPNARITRHDLRQALEEVLAGKAVSVPATRAVGCPLPTSRLTPPVTATVTYSRDVLPILQNHCQGCHRPGEIGPFPLLTYRQAVNWAQDIKAFTRERKMPPWKPVGGLPMHGERKLTDRQIAVLAAWADGGTPEGDPAAAPPPRRFAEGWKLGPPDLVLTVADDFALGASGTDLYRCFVLPTHLPADRTVTAVEVRPGNRRVVHHAVLFADTTGQARKVEARARGKYQGTQDHGPGYSMPMGLSFLPGFLPKTGLGGWAPGQVIRHFPEGTGFPLPRGADVVMQLHYHRNGRAETDRTSVGLYFARKPAARRIQGVVVPGHFLFIPVAEHYRVAGSVWVGQDCHLHAIMPHMHLLGRAIKLTMVPPGGPPRTLVAIADWDFNWQETYFFKEAVAVPAGTRFDIEGIFDNSARNPSNPHHPPRPVMFGLETTNEMCLGFLGMTADQGGTIRYAVQPRIQGVDWRPSWGIPIPGI
jgi:peroxiredoxin